MTVADQPDRQRYEAEVEGELAGFAAYHRRPGLVAFVHTEVRDRFEGHGVGSALARSALDDARAQALAVLPFCPFVRGWIERHPEYVELVPADRRDAFALA